ncbi:hypothetical protein E2C01_095037 [Portunus trituberculatus]|uniref:Uncharacterized protein n=1 Tax=Portunus trituberculatus TaxID=210409 RepID=A0A5B7JNS7_PORTR|nr:hypothetical protein [Portunus trituberculatus]
MLKRSRKRFQGEFPRMGGVWVGPGWGLGVGWGGAGVVLGRAHMWAEDCLKVVCGGQPENPKSNQKDT